MTRRQKILLILGLCAFAAVIATVLVYWQISKTEVAAVTYPEEYTVLTQQNAADDEQLAQKLGYSADSLSHYMQQKSVISLAINSDNSAQMRLVCRETDLSRELGDITKLSDSRITAIADSLLKNQSYTVVTLGDKVFLKSQTEESENGNTYAALQYVTVSGGEYYCFNYYGSSRTLTADESALADSVAATLYIPDGGAFPTVSANDTLRVFYIVLIAAVILLGIISIVLLSISLIRDISKRRASSGDEWHIKRRNDRL